VPASVKKAGVHKPTVQPYVKVGGTQRPGKKLYLKKAGAWGEVWPRIPNPPTNVKMTTTVVGDNVVINGSWSAPVAGGWPWNVYRVRIHFPNRTGRAQMTPWVEKTPGQLTFSDDNEGVGWQHAAGEKVQVEVWTVRKATSNELEQTSAIIASTGLSIPGATAPPVIPTLPGPPAPTSFDVNISECEMTQTWVHPGGNSLSRFEIQTWLTGGAVTTYTVTAASRKWTTFPWNADTIGRATVNTQIRAVGPGGASVWTKISGVMPGPVSLSNYGYSGGVSGASLFCTVDNMDDGVVVYTQKYGANPVLQSTNAGNAGKVTYGYTNSFSHARDNVTRYRLGFLPRNATAGPALGWTGRPQWGGWCIKIPNPVFIKPVDCNTWWSIPIPGKWRTNPQADNWFYQGKSISGNSYGTLFYQTQVPDYFAVARIGYSVTITSWDVYTKRTNTGGLVAAVALNTWTHARDNDVYDSAPGLVDGPLVGPSLARDQKIWLALPMGWFANMMSLAARGITYYVPPGQADNQLRPEIGNVSNRYMILDKPTYGSTLDGQIPGTLRIYHDA
jgi:hypothetical protein